MTLPFSLLVFSTLSIDYNFADFTLPSSIKIERVTIRKPNTSSAWSRERREANDSRREPSESASKVTHLLNSILSNYDKIISTYSFDCYFRQTWQDDRLKFSASGHSSRSLSLAMSMLDKIWKPDVYFWNGAGSYVHTLTVPNKLVRLSEDGTVLYSARLTVKARCRMHLNRYPLDGQACRLVISSFAYPVDELQLHWKISEKDQGIQMDYEAVKELPQFTLSTLRIYNNTIVSRELNYSALEIRLFLDRHFGYFLMNFYVPCTLIVLLCWVAFWINREATHERIGLAITNVLTLVFMSVDCKSESPKTDLPTALDVYIWICLIFLFLSIIEFTIVHYFTKYNSGDQEMLELEREKIRRLVRRIPRSAFLSNNEQQRTDYGRSREFRSDNGSKKTTDSNNRWDGGRYSMYGKRRGHSRLKQTLSEESGGPPLPPIREGGGLTSPSPFARRNPSIRRNAMAFQADSLGWRLYYHMLNQEAAHDPFLLEGNSISSIDKAARVAMPICFCCVVLIYYLVYVNAPYDFTFESDQTGFIA